MEEHPHGLKILTSPSEGVYKDRGSKFLAFAWPVDREESVKEIIRDIRKEHHSARHHCYAYRIGVDDPLYRMNDDGEPSGTAGKPIYGQMLSFGVTNILIVVVRYFGGTLLGTSGLINAYRSAALDCLNKASLVHRVPRQEVHIQFAYNQMNPVMRILTEEGIEIKEKEFTDRCRMILDIPKTGYEKAMSRLLKIPDIQMPG